MRRLALIAVLVAGLAPGVWFRVKPAPHSFRLDLRFIPVPLPTASGLGRQLGPFRLQGAWRMTSHHHWFGSWSALVALPGGRLQAYSDRGYRLRFSPPGSLPSRPEVAAINPQPTAEKRESDAEGATRDPAS